MTRFPLGGILVVLSLSTDLSTDSSAQAQGVARDWPQWRGPNGDGISREKGWRANFDESGPKKVWEAKVGCSFSSPVIRQGRLYLLATDSGNLHKEMVLCLDCETGKELWNYSNEIQSVKRASNPAGGTPALGGEYVFTYGAGMTLVALDAKTGKLTWTRDLMKELPGQPAPYGTQLSPTPIENLIIVPALVNQKIKAFAGSLTEPRGGPYSSAGGCFLPSIKRPARRFGATPRGSALGRARSSQIWTAKRRSFISRDDTCLEWIRKPAPRSGRSIFAPSASRPKTSPRRR